MVAPSLTWIQTCSLAVITTGPPEAVTGVLEDIEARHGGVDAYLLDGGASEVTLTSVRARLLEL